MITVTMFWDFGSAVSSQRQAAGDHVQASVSRDLQQQEEPQQTSENCSRCQRRRCATLSQVTIQHSNQLWKVRTVRTHTISSTERHHHSRHTALPLDRIQDKFLVNIMKRSSGNRTRAQGHLQWMASMSLRRCHVPGGQLQQHRNEGHLQGFDLYCGGRPSV